GRPRRLAGRGRGSSGSLLALFSFAYSGWEGRGERVDRLAAVQDSELGLVGARLAGLEHQRVAVGEQLLQVAERVGRRLHADRVETLAHHAPGDVDRELPLVVAKVHTEAADLGTKAPVHDRDGDPAVGVGAHRDDVALVREAGDGV